VSRSLVEHLSDAFELIGRQAYDRRWITLAGTAAILAVFGALAATTRFDTSFENFFDAEDPTYGTYLDYRDDFGSDEVAYLMYEVPGATSGAWDYDAMRRIESLTRALEEEVPFVSEVISPTNAEFMDPIEDGVEVYDLLEDFPGDQDALLAIRDRVLAKPIYVGGLTSEDGRAASIVLEMEASSIDPPDELRLDPEGGDRLENLYPQVSAAAIDAIIARPEYSGITFHHTGDVPLNAAYNLIVADESARFLALTMLLVAGTLLAFFRRPIGALGPIAVVAVSLVATVGFVGAMGWPLDMFFSMMPTLLIAIGVASAVHIVCEFGRQMRLTGDRRASVRDTLKLVGPPCFLTSLTTSIGFGAMAASPIVTLERLAAYASFGVMAAFFFSITLLVVLLSFGRHSRATDEAHDAERPLPIERGLSGMADFTIRRRRGILLVAAGVLLVSLAGASRLTVDSNFLLDLSDQVPARNATLYVDEIMGGTMSYVYLLDTGKPDGIKNPAFLAELERFQAQTDLQSDVVRKTYSIVDLLKDINQTFHGGDPAWHVLPETRELVAQYLLVYEMSGGDEISEYVSSDYSRASLSLRCRWVPTSRIEEMLARLDEYVDANPFQHARLERSGIAALWTRMLDYITTSQIRGILIALIAITGVMSVLFRSIVTGMIAMVPNVIPVAVTLGAMGWLGLPLGYTTVLIAPVAIGIAVDDTMHLMTRLRLEFTARRNYSAALHAALGDVGRPLLITSVVLVVGFLVNLLSVTTPQQHFGILLASTIIMALVCDFLVLPALVIGLKPLGPEVHEPTDHD